MLNLELYSRPVSVKGVKMIKRTIWRPRTLLQLVLGSSIILILNTAFILIILKLLFGNY